jgi:hypothetical protein
MGDKTEPVMPELLRDLATLINRMPVSPGHPNLWKRLRIAVTEEELAQMRGYFLQDSISDRFVHAVRGVPLEIEVAPESPAYIVEFPELVSETTLTFPLGSI